MIFLISFLLLVSVATNVVVVHRWIKLARVVLRSEGAIEECLDGIDDAYINVGKILQLPLATNDPKVAQIHRELTRVHDYLLRCANQLTVGWGEREDDANDRQQP